MNTIAHISFYLEPVIAKDLFLHHGLLTSNNNLHFFELDTKSVEYENLIKILNEEGIEFLEAQEDIFSEEEVENAELLRMIPRSYCGYPKPDSDNRYREVSYDLNTRCKKCLQGSIQNKPFHILKPKMGKKDIMGLHWVYEFIITTRFKQLIEQERLTGCEFWPVIDYRSKTEVEGVHQLFVTGTMPCMSEKANVVQAKDVVACECGKLGYTISGMYTYDREMLSNISDFNKMIEWLGGAYSTWQAIIVTKRVYDLIKQHKIRDVWFKPVAVV